MNTAFFFFQKYQVMKKIGILFLLSCQVCFAQTNITESISITSGQEVAMEFPYAQLINIRGWDGNTIELSAEVIINMGKNDDAYQFNLTNSNGRKEINGDIRDYDKLPEMIQIKKGGRVYYFDTEDWNSPEIRKFYEEEGREGISWSSHGVAREIKVEIKVPRSLGLLEVTSKFGLIDIEELNIPIQATSKHGGVDVMVSSSNANQFSLDSKWGVIYTDLDLDFKSMKGFEDSRDWSHVECSINGGTGPKVELISQHANIYLRKQ